MRQIDTERPLAPAILRGLARKCPCCGEGVLFSGMLNVVPVCAACGERFDGHRADDAPAWATMVIVGHLMIPVVIIARAWDLPVWAHMTLWPLLALGLSLALLPRVKGAVVAFQWALRMHGFDVGNRESGAP